MSNDVKKAKDTEEIVTVEAGTTEKVEETVVAPTNTTASINKPKQKTNAELAAETKKAQKAFGNAKKVKVSIPSVLAGQLGSTQFIGVNGVHVNVPVDGEDYEIPEPHAQVLKEMLKNLK